MEESRAKLTSRNFEEIGVGNFIAQRKAERFPGKDPKNPPPRLVRWRSNLSALSQKHNLYFVASTDKIHITAPRNLQQTLPGIPDLILKLPRTPAGIKLGGFIDEALPHCVNHVKVGNLGNLEVLLIACDDGDVLAYYTHILQNEIGSQDSHIVQAPLSNTLPFFHENVGSSAWGLALHQDSRLIAVSSNLREITIFAHGYTLFTDADDGNEKDNEESTLYMNRLRCIELQASVGNQKFPPLFGGNTASTGHRQYNYKMTLPLGEQGHNIPSVDFVSGTDGNASHLLAVDINGNLWNFNLLTSEKQCRPRIHEVTDRGDVMGWGVMCLPIQYFKMVKTPQEALGLPYLRNSFGGDSTTDPQCLFNINCTLKYVRESSAYHPAFNYGINGPGTIPEDDLRVPLLLDPDDAPWLSAESPAKKPAAKCPNPASKCPCHDPAKVLVASDIRTLKFVLGLLYPFRPYKWQQIKEQEVEDVAGTLVLPSECTLEEPLTRHEVELLLPPGNAVLRTYNHDMELIPANSPDMLRTFFSGIVRQELGPTDAVLQHFDRLNLLAVIPELSLVVAASQVGRAALITLTRLEDDFSSQGPVVMFRLDLILPLKVHEDSRPNVPLAGMAVAPLQGKARRWRLLMHYLDQTVLSYELYRKDGEELGVL